MKILLVSATESEIKPFIAKCELILNGNAYLNSYRYGNHHIDILISGVGMVSTSFHLGKHLNDSYHIAVNAGIAGSFNKNISIGEVINIKEDCLSELGAEDGDAFLSITELGLGKEDVSIENSYSNLVSDQLPVYKAITVNTVHGNENSIAIVQQRVDASIETMEGAAFIFACNQVGVPCLHIRAVSNYVERRNREKWNIAEAVSKLNKTLAEIIENI